MKLRRRPADLTDLATLQAQLDREREQSHDLAIRLAEAHELNRRVSRGRDEWRRQARATADENAALKAQLRAEAS